MNADQGGIAQRRVDARLERWLGTTLGLGTLIATALLAVGLFLELAAVAPGWSALLSQAGLIILMATPVARVVISVAEYAAQRDWPFMALTLAVLAMLAVSFVLGLG